MKIPLIILLFIWFTASRCVQSQCVDDINKLPMYGGIKKCPEQIAADQAFLQDCDKTFKNRKDAADHMIKRGWQYFYAKKMDTSMMRFNQAWLLDSLNAEIYWGFGNLLGSEGKYKESIPFFDKSIKLNPANAHALNDESVSFGNLFMQTKDVQYLNSNISALKKAVIIDPKNAQFYGQLTAAYSYFTQKDSTRKYLKIAEHLDPAVINPEVKKLLSN